MTRALRMLAALVAVLATTVSALVAVGAGTAQAADPTKTFASDGQRPTAVAVDSTNRRTYVANSGSGTVSVIDTSTDTLRAPISITGTSSRPLGVAVNPTSRTLFVANANGTVSVLSTAGDSNSLVATLALPGAGGSVAVDTVNNTAWVVVGSAKAVVKIVRSGSTWVVAQTITLPAASAPTGIGIDPTAISATVGKVFVASAGQDRVQYVISTSSTGEYATTAGINFSASYGIDVDPAAHRAYVAVVNPNVVRVLNTQTNAEVGRIATVEPVAVAVDPVARQAYVVNRNRGNLSVYELGDGTLTESYDFTDVSSGRNPGLADVGADPATHSGYVANPQNDTISVIRPRTPNLQAQEVQVSSTAPSTPVLGTAYTVTATGGGSGNPVRLALDPTSTGCALTTSANGAAPGRITFTRYGTCKVNATQAAAPGYDAGSAQLVVDLPARPQSVAFTTSAPTGPLAGTTYPVSATGTTGGGAVSLRIDAASTAGACSLSGVTTSGASVNGTVTFLKPGTCLVDANQAATTVYSPADQTQQSITVSNAQAITFLTTPPADPAIGGSYVVRAKGGASGLPVVLSRSAGSAGVCSLGTTTAASGVYSATVSFTGRGTCTVLANQAGNSVYTAAPQVSQQVTLQGTAQEVTFTSSAPEDATVGGSYQARATGGGSGNPVRFSRGAGSTSGACNVAADGTVSFTGPGTCVVQADQDGSSTYDPGQQTQSFEITGAQARVLITSSAPQDARVGDTYEVTTSSSGSSSAVAIFPFDSDGVCTVADAGDGTATVTFTGVGDCTVVADQPGDSDHADSQAQQKVAVTLRDAHLGFTTTEPADPRVGDTYEVAVRTDDADTPVTLFIDPADADSCSLVSTGPLRATITFEKVGDCHLYASQEAGATYGGGYVGQGFDVRKAFQTITFTSTPPDPGRVGRSYTIAARGNATGTGGTVSFGLDQGSTDGACSVTDGGDGTARVDFTGDGTCAVRADLAGDDDHEAASAVQQIAVGNLEQQAITFTSTAPTKPKAGTTYQVSATGGDSGNPVRFSVDPTSRTTDRFADSHSEFSVCEVDDHGDGTATVSVDLIGTCVVAADQDGDATHAPADRVRQQVTVARNTQRITYTSEAPRNVKIGDVYHVSATGGATGKPVLFSATVEDEGICTVVQPTPPDGTAVVTFTGYGRCVINARQNGRGESISQGPLTRQVVVLKVPRTPKDPRPRG